MIKIISVIGLLEKNSGKTFLTRNLGKYLKNDFAIIPFKPISGSNFWYHPENTKYSINNKVLISQDLRYIIDSINEKLSFPLTTLNPVHSLFHPNGLDEVLERKTTFEQISQSSFWLPDKPLIIRYSIWDEETNKEKRIHVVSKDTIPDSLQDIINHSDEVHYYKNLDDLAKFDKMFSHLALFSNLNYVLKKMKEEMNNPLLIVEGFNNIVPISQVIQLSTGILIVAPGKIALVEVDKFKKTQKFLKTEYLNVNKYLDHSLVTNIFSVPFNPTEIEWNSIIKKIYNVII